MRFALLLCPLLAATQEPQAACSNDTLLMASAPFELCESCVYPLALPAVPAGIYSTASGLLPRGSYSLCFQQLSATPWAYNFSVRIVADHRLFSNDSQSWLAWPLGAPFPSGDVDLNNATLSGALDGQRVECAWDCWLELRCEVGGLAAGVQISIGLAPPASSFSLLWLIIPFAVLVALLGIAVACYHCKTRDPLLPPLIN